MLPNAFADYEYTEIAWNSFYDAVDSTQFLDKDAPVIYESLLHNFRLCSFGDYLKRYIYFKAELTQPFPEVPLKEYQLIIKSSFSDNYTPASFTATTAKLSALSKNWLTQQSVKRNVVFLLGFGLNMSVDDVNMFLTKALREQKINPKSPLEVICWYCYSHHYNFLKFDQLWSQYSEIPALPGNHFSVTENDTITLNNSMHFIQDDKSLMAYLSGLKANTCLSQISITARKHFDALYDEARDLIAELYNTLEENKYREAVEKYRYKLSHNDQLYDYEKKNRIQAFQSDRKNFSRQDITESDIEHIICSAIPTDRHGNLSPGKASLLNNHFSGKRFSRQHIHEILSGKEEVSRFDLITLNFFIFSQKLDLYPEPKTRYFEFEKSMDDILEKCFWDKLHIQNPYECFILMCILSNDPLGTYADVWELSYRK